MFNSNTVRLPHYRTVLLVSYSINSTVMLISFSSTVMLSDISITVLLNISKL